MFACPDIKFHSCMITSRNLHPNWFSCFVECFVSLPRTRKNDIFTTLETQMCSNVPYGTPSVRTGFTLVDGMSVRYKSIMHFSNARETPARRREHNHCHKIRKNQETDFNFFQSSAHNIWESACTCRHLPA